MYKFRRISLALIFLIVPFSALAQKPENAENREQFVKLAEQILADAQNLQLPENRAVVYAQVGAQIWQTDKKRGEQLFQTAIGELINAQNQAAFDAENYYNQGLRYGQSPRVDILNLIASRDAELALKMQIKSRPANLAKILASAVRNGKNEKSANNNQQYVVQELNLERQFKMMWANQNPERAVEIFRDSLKSGVSYNAISFLQNLHRKSPDAANQLLAETIEKLLSVKFTDNNISNDFGTMLNFLTQFGNKQADNSDSLTVSDALLRSLADKISTHWLNLKNSYYYNENAFNIIEKFFPNRLAQIKQKQSEQNKNNEEYLRYSELMKNDPTAEELLGEAENFSNFQGSLYSQAAQKLAQTGNLTQAENIINSNLPADQAKNQLSNIYQNLAQQEISKGNFDQAENLINQITQKQSRVAIMTNLAQSIYNKNPEENKNRAVAVLDRADSLIENPISTLNDISMKLGIASAYLQIDSEKSFRIVEPLIPLFNEYVRAQAVISKFNGDGILKNGEYGIENARSMGGINYLRVIIAQLQIKDFNRTMQLINGLERLETRIGLKLQLIEQIQNLPINGRIKLRSGF